jgi:hypothetical protein
MGQGIGILVSKIPKETAASYSLREPSEVVTQLYPLLLVTVHGLPISAQNFYALENVSDNQQKSCIEQSRLVLHL